MYEDSGVRDINFILSKVRCLKCIHIHILWPKVDFPAPFHEHGHIHDDCLKYVLHMLLVGGLLDLVYLMCSVYLILDFCQPSQHSGYSDLLWTGGSGD
jgi:RsiW-degrading membrane proteinase PrsW (M82 family)